MADEHVKDVKCLIQTVKLDSVQHTTIFSHCMHKSVHKCHGQIIYIIYIICHKSMSLGNLQAKYA